MPKKVGDMSFNELVGWIKHFSRDVRNLEVQALKLTAGDSGVESAGDISGSGKGIFVQGIETAGDLKVSGSIIYSDFTAHTISGSKGIFVGSVEVVGDIQTSGSLYARHDVSGSGKGLFVGGVEVQGDIQTSGSILAHHIIESEGDFSGSGKGIFVQGIETAGDLKVSGSLGINTTAPEAYIDIKNTVDDGTTNRTMLRLHNYRSDDADVNDFGPISIDFDIENLGGGTKTGTARIAAVSSPVGTDHSTVLGEKTSGLIFSTMNDDTLAEAMRINAVGNVGIGTTSPMTSLDVIHDYNATTFENQLSDGEGGGRILRYSPGADDTLTAGQLYFLHTDGTWNSTDADAASTGGSQLLGVGLGGSARTVGVLLQGFIKIPSTEVLNVPGGGASDGLPVYISTTTGHLDFTPPSASGDIVRIVGYCIDDDSSDILLWFCPGTTWVEIA